jgi:hypothetical protein
VQETVLPEAVVQETVEPVVAFDPSLYQNAYDPSTFDPCTYDQGYADQNVIQQQQDTLAQTVFERNIAEQNKIGRLRMVQSDDSSPENLK